MSRALLARQNHWGLFHLAALPYPASLLIGVVALDGSLYALHRLFHVIPLLWRFHQVHHSDLDVDCSTTIRHHRALPEPVDRQLRWLLVSPDMHRIHHSANATESNRNFGNVPPWWDHLFFNLLACP